MLMFVNKKYICDVLFVYDSGGEDMCMILGEVRLQEQSMYVIIMHGESLMFL